MDATVLRYLDALRASKSARTAKCYGLDVRGFLSYLAGLGVIFSEVTADDFRTFLRTIAEKYSKRTQARRFCAVRHFYKWLCDERILQKNPTAEVSCSAKITNLLRETKPLDAEQMEKILTRAGLVVRCGGSNRDSIILICLGFLGLRVDEIESLCTKDYNATTDSFLLKKKNRVVFVPERFKSVFLFYFFSEGRQRVGPWAFQNKNFGRLGVRGIRRLIYRAGLDAGIPDLAPRHLHAFYLASRRKEVKVD
jgi:site-specific recombinase XerD